MPFMTLPAIGGQWYIIDLIIFHNNQISQGLWKIFGTTFECIVVLQSRGHHSGERDRLFPGRGRLSIII